MKYALAFLLVTAGAARAEVPKQARVTNPGGYCCWACLETLGRMNDISELRDLLKNRMNDDDDYFLDLRYFEYTPKQYPIFKYVPIPKNIGDERSIQKKLKALHIKHEIQHTGDFDTRLLDRANTQGCLVVIDNHGVVLSRYGPGGVEYYDPNDSSTHTGSLSWFHEKWNGMVVTLQK